jgi:two-component system, NarL family, response regulator NreC
MNEEPITVIFADDHPAMELGLVSILKERVKHINILATASNGEQLVNEVNRHLPQVVVTDVMMPVMDGIDATKLIRKNHHEIKILGFSNYAQGSLIKHMVDAGANGYMLKNVPLDEISKAITIVQSGQTYYCNQASSNYIGYLHAEELNNQRIKRLTKQEVQVLKLIAKGNSSKEIGRALYIGSRTVETHRQKIYLKTGCKNIADIANYARDNGYLDDGVDSSKFKVHSSWFMVQPLLFLFLFLIWAGAALCYGQS